MQIRNKLLAQTLTIAALTAMPCALPTAYAAPILPVSYNMQNGQATSVTYYDDSYTGSGCKTCDLSYCQAASVI